MGNSYEAAGEGHLCSQSDSEQGNGSMLFVSRGAAPHTVKKIPPHQHQLEFIYDFSIAGAKDLAFYFLDDEDTKFIFHKELDAEHQNQPLYVYITIQDGRRCVRKDPHGKELYQE